LRPGNTLKPSTSCLPWSKLRRDPAINGAHLMKLAKVLLNQGFTAKHPGADPG
jgi:hypothetical protein